VACGIGEAAPVNGDEVRDTWLLSPSGGGYEGPEVDDLLRRVAAELDAGRPAGSLIESAAFGIRSGKGYDIDAVDWFLGELLLGLGHTEQAEADADPWRDVGDLAQFVRGGVSGLAERYPRYKPTQQEAQNWFSEQCQNAWRDFGQQPGVALWWGRAGRGHRELHAAGQAIASVDGRGPMSFRYADMQFREPKPYAVSVGGRHFTLWVGPRRSSSPLMAEIFARDARDCAGHFAKPERRPKRPRVEEVRKLADEEGSTILYTSGENYCGRAYACVSFPDGRWLRFPVRGTKATNAIMTAVDQAGNKVARYRLAAMGRGLREKLLPYWKYPVEIIVNPCWELTDELVLAIAVSAEWLSWYFTAPSA
jgi:hypothetical protein